MANWIDKAYIQQFMYELLDTPYYLRRSIHVEYSPYTAAWNISNKRNISGNDVAAWNTYGTDYVSAYEILEDSLNLRDVRVYDTVEDEHGKPPLACRAHPQRYPTRVQPGDSAKLPQIKRD